MSIPHSVNTSHLIRGETGALTRGEQRARACLRSI
jgi:hypothetical protein